MHQQRRTLLRDSRQSSFKKKKKRFRHQNQLQFGSSKVKIKNLRMGKTEQTNVIAENLVNFVWYIYSCSFKIIKSPNTYLNSLRVM